VHNQPLHALKKSLMFTGARSGEEVAPTLHILEPGLESVEQVGSRRGGKKRCTKVSEWRSGWLLTTCADQRLRYLDLPTVCTKYSSRPLEGWKFRSGSLSVMKLIQDDGSAGLLIHTYLPTYSSGVGWVK